MLEMQPSISHHIDTGPSSAGRWLSAVFALLPLAAAGYVAYQCIDAADPIAPWPWVAFWVGCIAVLAFAPWQPVVGILAFIAAAYGTPRYAPAFDGANAETLYGGLMALQTLNWICGFTLLGWLAGSLRQRLKPKNPGVLIFPFVLFIAWQVVCVVMMLVNGTEWDPHANHHPERYVQALIMFILAGQVLRHDVDAVALALTLGATICTRWALTGAGIELEGDIPVLAVIAIPILFIGFKASWSSLIKLALIGMVIAMVVLIILTKNRNALIAFIVLLPMLWLTARQKLPVLIMAVPALIIAGIIFAQSSNWKRFEALITGTHDINSANQRLLLWQSGLRMTMKHPLFGVGPGNFHNEVAKFQPPAEDHWRMGADTAVVRIDDDEYAAHNSVIHLLGESGFIGAGLFLMLFFAGWILSVTSRPVKDTRGLPQYGWPYPAVKLLMPAMVAYLAIGVFVSRQDMVFAYLLAGWFSAAWATHRAELKRTKLERTQREAAQAESAEKMRTHYT